MLIFLFLIGACIGSFLGVLATRLPRGESVLWGRSHCDYCGKPLRWFELIPIFSFIIQKGRCLRCHKKLSWSYPLLELVTGLGFVYLYPRVSLLVIFSCLLVIFISDMNYQIIPDSMVVIGAIAALFYYISPDTLLSAAGSFVFFYLLWLVTRGRGLGFGDVKLSVLIGLLLGYPLTIVAYYIAFLTGAGVGVILMIRRRAGWKSKIAFGPFLILGTVVAFIWGTYFITLWHTFL
jgi:leader peptidase (prepilin peptidase)/N-methyltransferase